MKGEVYNRNVDTWDEWLDRSLDADTDTNLRKDQLRRTTRDLRTGAAKCTEVDDGIFEHLL